jgi:hypothetical protein
MLVGLEAPLQQARARDEELDRVVLGQRLDLVLLLAGEAQRLTAGDEQGDSGSFAQELAERGRRLDHLLEVVEQEQRALAAEVDDELVGSDCRGDRRENALGIASSGERHHHTPCGNSSSSSAATWSTTRVLPLPPGPVSVTRRERRTSSFSSSSSRRRPTSGVGWTGRLDWCRVCSGGNCPLPSW